MLEAQARKEFMKMDKVIVSKWFVTAITFGFARGITLWPFIFLKYKKDTENRFLINHESIHLKQQAELWVIGFYILYLYYYLRRRYNGHDHITSYRWIPFEREASDNEYKLSYPRLRKSYGWRQYRQTNNDSVSN